MGHRPVGRRPGVRSSTTSVGWSSVTRRSPRASSFAATDAGRRGSAAETVGNTGQSILGGVRDDSSSDNAGIAYAGDQTDQSLTTNYGGSPELAGSVLSSATFACTGGHSTRFALGGPASRSMPLACANTSTSNVSGVHGLLDGGSSALALGALREEVGPELVAIRVLLALHRPYRGKSRQKTPQHSANQHVGPRDRGR